jgi:hypothetical protein
MSDDREPALALRQFRVTVTEDLVDGFQYAHLSWRTFPCEASRWDGHLWCTLPGPGPLPTTSQEALRAVLGALAAEPWQDAKRPRR